MPMIVYTCENKHSVSKFFRSAKDAPSESTCAKCDRTALKKLSGPNYVSKVTIDNGVMARSVEIIPSILEINQAKSEKDFTKE